MSVWNMSESAIYRIVFINDGKSYEIYAGNVQQGSLYGFIEVEKLLFGNRSGLLVDPSEEKLKTVFDGVKRTQIPMHSIVRIDEVEKQGVAKISEAAGSVVTPFPLPAAPKN